MTVLNIATFSSPVPTQPTLSNHGLLQCTVENKLGPVHNNGIERDSAKVSISKQTTNLFNNCFVTDCSLNKALNGRGLFFF